MNFKFIPLTTCLLLSYTLDSVAGELEFKPSISTSIIQSQHDSERVEDGADGNTSILSVNPSLRTSYISKLLNGNLFVNHNQIESDSNDDSQSNSFTNYQYSGNISLIDKILSLNLSGGQSYRSILSSQYFVNDPYLDADGLAKTRDTSASAFFTLPSRRYFRFNLNGGVSNNKSEGSSVADSRFDNKNQFLDARLYQGSEFTRLSWNFSSNYQNTDRSIRDNLTSRVISGEIGFGLVINIRAVLTGRSEENELANSADLSLRDLNHDSYGLGLSWFVSDNRKISLTVGFVQPMLIIKKKKKIELQN